MDIASQQIAASTYNDTEHKMAKLTQAFIRMLQISLSVTSQSELLVIFDEHISELAPYLYAAISKLNLNATFIMIPEAHQEHLLTVAVKTNERIELPNPLIYAITNADCILNLLNGKIENGPIRGAVVGAPRRNGARLLHIPGLSTEILELASTTNFSEIEKNCELLAWILGNGSKGQLVTKDGRGKEHYLALDLGGWKNEPIMSSGIIPAGSWGNFPPGEVFLCPITNSASGRIFLNGSLPRMAFRDGAGVLLHFLNGRLTEWEHHDQQEAAEFFDRQMREASARGDINWNHLSELGIGLNERITELTGNDLLDEKAGGTIHIAIGNNAIFGGPIKSDIHADMVALKPTLIVDDLPVISSGKIELKGIALERKRFRPRKADFVTCDDRSIRLDAANMERRERSVLRKLVSGHRVGFIEMAASVGLRRALAETCDNLSSKSAVRVSHFVQDHPKIGRYDTRTLLNYLAHYECLIVE